MTNKTKAAIEEDAKLPTAYQTLNNHLSRVGLTLATAHESILLDAIKSHTAAHTAALRDQIADLERENNNYRLVYDSVVKNRDELRERMKELEGEVNRKIDNLHMEIHVMITDARIAATKLGIDPDKSEALDRLLYDLDVLQGKMMDAFKTEEKK